MKKPRWTQEEIKILKKNYYEKGSHETAKLLNKDYRAVQRKANRIGINGNLNIKGERNPNYKGGTWICKTFGYVWLSGKHECPYSNNRGRIREHDYVWWLHYGKTDPILRNEVVHHDNGDKQDNRIENLKKMTKAEHTRLHNHLNPNKHYFCRKKRK